MKSNNLVTIKSRVINAATLIYNQSGNTDIPTIEQVSSIAKTDKRTTVKYLYQWWQEHSHSPQRNHDYFFSYQHIGLIDDNLRFVDFNLQSLSAEIQLHSERLNVLSEQEPLSNIMVDTLYQAQDKLYQALESIDNLKVSNEHLLATLEHVCDERDELYRQIEEMRDIYANNLAMMRSELDEAHRIAASNHHKLKAVKRHTILPKFKKASMRSH